MIETDRCHMKTNGNRATWEERFTEIMANRGGL